NTTLTDGFIYNVGTGTQTNLKAVFKSFENGFDYHIPYQFEAPRLGDIKHSCADITPLKSLGYKPKYSIEEGITAYLTYNKHNNINI
ncbi:NAD-dependent dehydratase, partial [Staphylococcus hominis]|nr:NAD-dependent dehydratase [Staphylococcus hominis]